MMKYYKLMQIFCFALLTQAMDCGEDFGESPNQYSKNQEGRPEYQWIVTISADRFNSHVVGRGWKWKRAMRITEEGAVEALAYTGNGYPRDYYFTADSVVVFEYYKDQNVRHGGTYSYDETRNTVVSPLIEYMQISGLSGRMMTVEWCGSIGYVENYYEEMLPHELNAQMLGFKDESQ